MGGPVITSRGEHERRSRPLLRTMIGDGCAGPGGSRAGPWPMCPGPRGVDAVPVRGGARAQGSLLRGPGAICDALRIDLSDLLAGVAHDLAADQVRRARYPAGRGPAGPGRLERPAAASAPPAPAPARPGAGAA